MAKVSRAEALDKALRNPDYWREQMRRCAALAWPQRKARNTLLRAMLDNQVTREGGTWVVMSARQTMKNEVEAEVEALTLYGFAKVGGIYVRTAPSRDQIVTSRQRLMDVLNTCPVCQAYGRARQTEGGFTVLPWSRARVRYVTANPTAHVVGATASLALSNDEFQDVDQDYYQNAIEPFIGSTNAPAFCWGVSGDGSDMLQQERDRNDADHPERNLIFPADIWAEIWPGTYGRTWASRVSKYGLDNPSVRMNYLLQPVQAVASFLGSYTESLLAGQHSRVNAPSNTDGMDIVIMIDVAGEEDLSSDEVVKAIRSGKDDLDSTAVIIAGVNRNAPRVGDLPSVRILDLRIWVGRPWEEQQQDLNQLIDLWHPRSVVIDQCGIGQMLARSLRKRFGDRVLAYAADTASIDEDCNELYAYLYNGQVKMFRNDNSASYEDAVLQLRAARRINRNGKLKVAKDKSTDRIDFAKALTYLPRAVRRVGGSTSTSGASTRPARSQPRTRDLTKRW